MDDKNDLEKQRAIFAFQRIENFINNSSNDEKKQKKYRAYIRNTPSMILNNGLGATIAFMFSKRLKSEGVVYNQLAENIYDWLKEEQNCYLIKLKDKSEAKDKLKELMNEIINLDSQQYRATTNEILALFGWLKRFADGMIEDKKDGD